MRKNLNHYRETHEGGKASNISALDQLKRTVLACMLWEDTFYEEGEFVSNRIARLVGEIGDTQEIADLAIKARKKMHLRHVPLWIIVSMLSHPKHKLRVSSLIPEVVNRPDEMCELISLYWKKEGRRVSLAHQLKKGLAQCFHKFSEYSLAKNDSNSAAISIRDVMFLVHPKPVNEKEANLFKKIANEEMDTPDTWEVSLSAKRDKKETFERLMKENALGDLAFLRNLRNMQQAGIPKETIVAYGDTRSFSRVLPFRFIAAARAAMEFEPDLERYLLATLQTHEKLSGRTVLVIDVSGSMDNQISNKSDLIRIDAASALAMILRELCDDITMYTFSEYTLMIPPRRGFALRDAICSPQLHRSTYLRQAVEYVNEVVKYDRIVIITDEQSADGIASPRGENAYILNVGSYENGVGYGEYTHITGFSEAVVDYIQQLEQLT